ncbi:unnamed protein product [Orchesella dallaii]|uniref:Secreted protein n=1 Tax=Orchesella dallaii TaxID=48710 RepID=A0ABP1R425_9HEXA
MPTVALVMVALALNFSMYLESERAEWFVCCGLSSLCVVHRDIKYNTFEVVVRVALPRSTTPVAVTWVELLVCIPHPSSFPVSSVRGPSLVRCPFMTDPRLVVAANPESSVCKLE